MNCVEMKRRGAEAVMAETRGMTFDEELAYWREQSRELRAFQTRYREQAACDAEKASQDDES